MDVRPEHEQREDQVDAARRTARVRGEQGHEHDEEQLSDVLRPQLHSPRGNDEGGDTADGHALGRRTEAPRGTQAGGDGEHEDQRVREQHRPHAAEQPEPVEAELPEPLLVDPGPARRPCRQRVGVRQPVLGNLATAEEREPTVLHELLRQGGDDDDEPERDDRPTTTVPASGTASTDGTRVTHLRLRAGKRVTQIIDSGLATASSPFARGRSAHLDVSRVDRPGTTCRASPGRGRPDPSGTTTQADVPRNG